LGPYDVILIDGGVETVPEGLRRQLPSHGRLARPDGKSALFQFVNGGNSRPVLFDANAPVLPSFKAVPIFVF
jgi:protein-L-isoaspartate(D-aspartate) O-methyltransferase